MTRQQQDKVRTSDNLEPLHYSIGDLVGWNPEGIAGVYLKNYKSSTQVLIKYFSFSNRIYELEKNNKLAREYKSKLKNTTLVKLIGENCKRPRD